MTTACLNALAKENIAVVVCDHAHMPSAMLQPFSGNTLAQRHTEAQLRATEALKARLWRQTVKAKITNQAECLKRLGLPDRRLRVLAESVKAGDSDNAEAVAARYYFQQLAEPEAFSRCRDRDSSESRAELRIRHFAGGSGPCLDGFRAALRGGDSPLESVQSFWACGRHHGAVPSVCGRNGFLLP